MATIANVFQDFVPSNWTKLKFSTDKAKWNKRNEEEKKYFNIYQGPHKQEFYLIVQRDRDTKIQCTGIGEGKNNEI